MRRALNGIISVIAPLLLSESMTKFETIYLYLISIFVLNAIDWMYGNTKENK